MTSHANLYYGCWSAVLTLLTLDQRYLSLSLPAACFATAVALWAAYATAERYELRARDFYLSYLQLQKLWTECETAEQLPLDNDERAKELDGIWIRYCDVLASTENHTEEDYIKYLFGEYEKEFNDDALAHMSRLQRRQLWRYRALYWIQRLVVYVVFPAILLFSPLIAEQFV